MLREARRSLAVLALEQMTILSRLINYQLPIYSVSKDFGNSG